MTTWVLFAGLPGTGKSTLARAIAERLDAAVLDKDRVRGALFPGSLTDYTAQQDELCMRAMLEAAAYLTELERAEYIFFDGRTFSRRAQIEDVLLSAVSAGARWRVVHVKCADAVAEERLARSDPSHPARIAMRRYIAASSSSLSPSRSQSWRSIQPRAPMPC